MPEGGKDGYVRLRVEGVRELARIAMHGDGGQRAEAAKLLNHLMNRAEAAGEDVFNKLMKLVEEGEVRGAFRLVGMEEAGVKILEVNKELRDDKLYVAIRAVVDGVEEVYKIVFYRGDKGYYIRLYVRGEEAKARGVKLLKVLTGREPFVSLRPDGRFVIGGSGGHVEAMTRYEELREAIEEWRRRGN